MDDDKYSRGFLAWFLRQDGLYAVNQDGSLEKISEDEFWLEGFFQHLNNTMANQ